MTGYYHYQYLYYPSVLYTISQCSYVTISMTIWQFTPELLVEWRAYKILLIACYIYMFVRTRAYNVCVCVCVRSVGNTLCISGN